MSTPRHERDSNSQLLGTIGALYAFNSSFSDIHLTIKKRFCLFEVLTLMFHCLFTSILPIYQTEMVRIQRQTVHTDAFGQFPVGHPDKQHINEQQVDLLGGRCPGRFKAWSTPVRISLIFLAHPYVNHLDFHQHICRRSILCSLIINKTY